jgi:hypothetical protein
MLLSAVSLTVGEPARPLDSYVIKPLRWEEDYAHYQAPAYAGFLERWKRIAVSEEGAFVSFGGEARMRTERYDEPLFGTRGAQDFTSTFVSNAAGSARDKKDAALLRRHVGHGPVRFGLALGNRGVHGACAYRALYNRADVGRRQSHAIEPEVRTLTVLV